MKKFVRAVLEPRNETELESHAKETLVASPYYSLLKLIAQVCDERARGENVWLNIGTDKYGTALLVTLHQDLSVASAGGSDLVAVCHDVTKLL